MHYLEDLGADVEVFRNDKISLEEVEQFDKIVLSPGPGVPKNAGIVMDLIKKYAPTKSILGISLGHQAICMAIGAELYNLDEVYHGKLKKLKVNTQDSLFAGLPQEFEVGLYQSWAVKNLSDDMKVIAEDENGEILAVRHKEYNLVGLQFHPESIMTEHGKEILSNWLKNK